MKTNAVFYRLPQGLKSNWLKSANRKIHARKQLSMPAAIILNITPRNNTQKKIVRNNAAKILSNMT